MVKGRVVTAFLLALVLSVTPVVAGSIKVHWGWEGKAGMSFLQFHFHAPVEHTVDGKPYPMEMDLVHKCRDGSMAVVGVFIEEGAGNRAIEKIMDAPQV